MPAKKQHRIEAYFQKSILLLALACATYLTSNYFLANPRIPDMVLGRASSITGNVLVLNAPYYMMYASKKAAAAAAWVFLALFAIRAVSSKKAEPAAIAILAASLPILLASEITGQTYPIAILAAAGLSRIKCQALSYGKTKVPKGSHLLLVILAASPLAWYPFVTDMHLGSSAWMIYKKTNEVYATGFIQKEDLADNRFSLYPPLSFYLLAAGKHILGLTAMDTLQIFFSISNLLLIATTYLLARSIGGSWFAVMTVVLVSFMPKLVTAPAYGNYAQLASNSFALASLLFFVKYREGEGNRNIPLAAFFFGLTVLTHWLLAILLGAFYSLQIYAIAKKERQNAIKFVAITAAMAAPYLLYLAKAAILSGDSAWFYIKMAQSEQESGLLQLILPVGDIGDVRYVLLAFGISGLLLGRNEKRLQPIYLLFLLPAAGYLLFEDYITFFYPSRYLFYIQFFFSFFISYGITKTMEKRQALFSLVFGLILVYATYSQTISNTELAKGDQVLGKEDFAAAMWLKENAQEQEIVAADAIRMEFFHGFSGSRVPTPMEALLALKNPAGINERTYIYLSEAGTCKFPCSYEIQLRKDATMRDIWTVLSYSKTTKKIEEAGSKLVFSEGSAKIYK